MSLEIYNDAKSYVIGMLKLNDVLHEYFYEFDEIINTKRTYSSIFGNMYVLECTGIFGHVSLSEYGYTNQNKVYFESRISDNTKFPNYIKPILYDKSQKIFDESLDFQLSLVYTNHELYLHYIKSMLKYYKFHGSFLENLSYSDILIFIEEIEYMNDKKRFYKR